MRAMKEIDRLQLRYVLVLYLKARIHDRGQALKPSGVVSYRSRAAPGYARTRAA